MRVEITGPGDHARIRQVVEDMKQRAGRFCQAADCVNGATVFRYDESGRCTAAVCRIHAAGRSSIAQRQAQLDQLRRQ